MAATKIATSREFFDHVVTEDIRDFTINPTDLRAAYHAANSLLSLRDWVVEEYARKPWQYQNTPRTPFTTKTGLQTALEQFDHRFAIVTDIANASKHMVLDRNRSRTKLWGNANTEFRSMQVAIPASGQIATPPGAPVPPCLVVKIDETDYDVWDCVYNVHIIWKGLMTENAW